MKREKGWNTGDSTLPNSETGKGWEACLRLVMPLNHGRMGGSMRLMPPSLPNNGEYYAPHASLSRIPGYTSGCTPLPMYPGIPQGVHLPYTPGRHVARVPLPTYTREACSPGTPTYTPGRHIARVYLPYTPGRHIAQGVPTYIHQGGI